jgi:Gamma-glutamyltranspeptidase
MDARRFRAVSSLAILAFAACVGEARQQSAFDGWGFPVDRVPVTYGRDGMVSTTDRVASEVGVEVLRRGGNAVDAAVATHFALANLAWASCVAHSSDDRGGCLSLHCQPSSGGLENLSCLNRGAARRSPSWNWRHRTLPCCPDRCDLCFRTARLGTLKWARTQRLSVTATIEALRSQPAPEAGASVTAGAGGASGKVRRAFGWRMEQFAMPNSIGTKRPELDAKNSRSSGTWSRAAMTVTKRRFAICVRNDGYEASLERRKIYQVLPDPDAAKHRQVRVIDESGEDYLYPDSYFAAIELPETVRRAVLSAV